MSIASHPPIPPFCTSGADFLPDGPRPGTAESLALAAWEVLTGARLARSAGSGRMSMLARHRRECHELTREVAVHVALHAFEGADERWQIRRARGCCATDEGFRSALIQEMGGPAADPEEMTSLGFWIGDRGFTFDCRGPTIDLLTLDPLRPASLRRKHISPAMLLAHARYIRGLAHAADGTSIPQFTSDQAQLVLL